MTTYVLYTIWFLIPATFFLIALWSKLEDWGGREKHENTGDYLRQGFFVLVCVIIAVVIDQNFLEDLIPSLFGDWLSIGVAQTLLLPFVLLIAAKVFGPTSPIQIASRNKRRPPRRK